MAFWLTVIYIVLDYLSPNELIPSIAPYRPMLILAVLCALVSIMPALSSKTRLLRARQTYLLIGFIVIIFVSELVHLWVGGLLYAADAFFPDAIVFFLLVINVTTWQRLRIVVTALVACTFLLLGQSLWAYAHYHGKYYFERETGHGRITENNLFVFPQEIHNQEGWVVDVVPRIRAVGSLSDPNDFAQFMLVTVPLLGLLWDPKRATRNIVVALLTALLVYGIYLTHSRGGLLAFIILMLVFLRRRLGRVASAALAGGLFMAALAVNFTGERGISIQAGMDRLEIWSDGLAAFKHSPLFGVGFGQFDDFAGGHTAHNSFLLCFTELGVIGAFFWTALLVVTVLELTQLLKSVEETNAPAVPATNAPAVPAMAAATAGGAYSQKYAETAEFPNPRLSDPPEAVAEARTHPVYRWALAIRLSLLAFIATGWFLSRTYVVTFYIMVGLSVALKGIAEKSTSRNTNPSSYNWVNATLFVMVACILLLYLSVRVRVFG